MVYRFTPHSKFLHHDSPFPSRKPAGIGTASLSFSGVDVAKRDLKAAFTFPGQA
jgi:hypothetical protein